MRVQIIAFFPPLENQKWLRWRQSLCEGHLSRKECLEALKSMASEKMRIRWSPLRILQSLLEWFSWNTTKCAKSLFWDRETFNITKTWHCHTCTKKDTELTLIKKWRPLTLLKIASKAIASRIKTFLPKLISEKKQALLKVGVLVRNISVCWTVSSNNYTKEKIWAFFFFLILRKFLIHSSGLLLIKPFSILVLRPCC